MVLPSYMGRLFEKEYCLLSGLMDNPVRPSVYVLGGAKINDAFMMMNTVLTKGVADKVLCGGLVALILDWALNNDIGKASRDFISKEGYAALVEKAKEILNKYNEKIIRPVDYAFFDRGLRKEAATGHIPENCPIIDIGQKTAEIYGQIIKEAKIVFVNGPMGIFEKEESSLGTKIVWESIGQTEAQTVVGGGDSISAAATFKVTEKIDHISTGGGAMIRFLSGEELPVVKALRHGATLF
jgi:phosphoglycerate kinase